MTDRTGILRDSPLIYVLASIRFAPWPLLAKKIDEIHDELREIVPLIQRIKVEPLGMGGQPLQPEEETRWMLMSADRSYGLHLASDQLLVFSSDYVRYAAFATILDMGLAVLLNHMRFVDVTNLGVRYIDRIKMREEEEYKDYITERLLPANFSGLECIGGVIKSVYKFDKAELRVNCITQPGALSIPNDLISVFAMAQEPGKPLQIEKLKDNEFLLDMDAINKFSVSQRIEDKTMLLKWLDNLHQIANMFFRHKDVCTEHAFKVWRGEV